MPDDESSIYSCIIPMIVHETLGWVAGGSSCCVVHLEQRVTSPHDDREGGQ